MHKFSASLEEVKVHDRQAPVNTIPEEEIGAAQYTYEEDEPNEDVINNLQQLVADRGNVSQDAGNAAANDDDNLSEEAVIVEHEQNHHRNSDQASSTYQNQHMLESSGGEQSQPIAAAAAGS